MPAAPCVPFVGGMLWGLLRAACTQVGPLPPSPPPPTIRATLLRLPRRQVQRFAFDSVCKVASLFYQHMTPYMDALFRLTTTSVERAEEVAIRAIEFWNVICEVGVAPRVVSAVNCPPWRALPGASLPCSHWVPSHALLIWTVWQVEIAIHNGSIDIPSMNYATAALGHLVPLTTSCMLKQVCCSPLIRSAAC
jgi:hypothetical protein